MLWFDYLSPALRCVLYGALWSEHITRWQKNFVVRLWADLAILLTVCLLHCYPVHWHTLPALLSVFNSSLIIDFRTHSSNHSWYQKSTCTEGQAQRNFSLSKSYCGPCRCLALEAAQCWNCRQKGHKSTLEVRQAAYGWPVFASDSKYRHWRILQSVCKHEHNRDNMVCAVISCIHMSQSNCIRVFWWLQSATSEGRY